MPLKLYKRPGGEIWHYRGTVAGRKFRGSTRTTDRETALRFISEKENHQWKGHFDGPAAVLTFAQAVAAYLRAGKSDRFVLEALDHFGPNKLVKDIAPGDIQQAALELYPNTSGATQNRQGIVPIQAVINHAAKLGKATAVRVERFPSPKREKEPADWEWVQAFRAHATPHLGALACFLYLTGARISEALDVTWEDVNFKTKRVIIRQGKLHGEERNAHMPDELVVALANIQRKGERVFRYALPKTAERPWSKCIKRAGIKRLSFHRLRHGFATGLLDAGVNPITVAKRGGWKSARHVFETYGHDVASENITDLLVSTPGAQPENQASKPLKKKA